MRWGQPAAGSTDRAPASEGSNVGGTSTVTGSYNGSFQESRERETSTVNVGAICSICYPRSASSMSNIPATTIRDSAPHALVLSLGHARNA